MAEIGHSWVKFLDTLRSALHDKVARESVEKWRRQSVEPAISAGIPAPVLNHASVGLDGLRIVYTISSEYKNEQNRILDQLLSSFESADSI